MSKGAKKDKLYKVLITDPEDRVMVMKEIPAEQVDKGNFTAQHRKRAILALLAKG